jgi:acyl-[acyl-carrier-protein]-phospholipid O-acyltransferase/long-chain-fatty-acid--[acyl-carrier-protein] ligase
MASPFALLTKVRFAPLFATNLLGTFNDNLFKTGLLMLASYGIFRGAPDRAAELGALATGLYVLPFFLVSAVAGQLADHFERGGMVRLVKGAEATIMAIGLLGFLLHAIPLLLLALFLMGVHSAVFGPLKYAILPLHLHKDELLGGVGLMEAGGYLAILGGQLLAGLVAPWQAGLIALFMAVLGLAASLAIPPARSAAEPEALDLNVVRASARLLGLARAERKVWLSMLGVAWFYVVGAVLLAELIPLVQGVLHAERAVAVLFLTLFSVGVASGAVQANRMLKGEVSARYAPPAALILAGLLLELSFAVRAFPAHAGALAASMPLARFLAEPAAWRVMADLFALSLVGGLYVIPLSAMIQRHSPYAIRSRIQSASSILTAASTVAALLVAGVLLKLGASLAALIGLLAAGTLIVAAVACFLLPETVIKAALRLVLRALYQVEVTGAEHMPPAGTGAVIVVNHVSYLDAALLAAFLPGKPTFAVHTRIARAWWMKPVLPLFDAFPVDTTNPLSTKAMVRAVQDGRSLVIFPEGRITVTGALMKVFGGPGMVADRAGAPIIPVRIDGAQYTPFSHMKGKLRLRRFPKIRIAILPQVLLETSGGPRERRAAAAARLYDVMSEMMFRTSPADRTLWGALTDAAAVHGRKAPAVEDVKRKPLSYGKLMLGARLLSGRIAAVTGAGEAVGLMLPNVDAAVAAFFALQRSGRVAAMLNYSAGPAHLQSACDTAKIRTVITSRAFVEQARLQGAVERLQQTGRRVLWLEDLAKLITAPAKLAALLSPERRPRVRAEDAAVILFTSGSEGAPKAVVLSHRNILANCAQTAARIDFNPTDRVLNALPIFHSFGLTGGLLLPLLNGVKVLLYPNPLHYAAIPALAYDASATILFGSETFLSGYARQAQGYDFYSLRYVFAGAEPVKAETRARFFEKFGLRILEGYGVTECAPVIAVNTPMHFRAGSVGRLLPGIEARLEPVPGVDHGGRLHVRGPNVMTGYFLAEAPGVLVPPKDGWHDSGDIVDIDEAGFVTILGRAKRFAKIGGEMVSLAAVEASAAAAWPGFAHAVVSRPDPKKGEQLVLFTTAPKASAQALSAWGRAHGTPELALPKDVRIVDALPVLATGKTDYVALNAFARLGEREEVAA